MKISICENLEGSYLLFDVSHVSYMSKERGGEKEKRKKKDSYKDVLVLFVKITLR